MQWFFVFRGQVIPVAKFDSETRQTVACPSRDVTIGETSFRRQIETMLLQGACKRLNSTNKRFSSVPLTSYTPHVPSIFQCHSPVSSCVSHVLNPSRTLDLLASLTCILVVLLAFVSQQLHPPKDAFFSVPVTSSTLLALQYFSFPVKHKDDFKQQLW